MTNLFILFILLFPLSLMAENCELKPTVKKYIPKHAKNFQIDYKKDYKIISTKSEKYLVANDVRKIKCQFDFKINTVSKNIVMTSTTYLPTLSLLGREDLLVAFQGKKYIYNSKFNLNKIDDIGFSLSPENLIKYSPQLIISYMDNMQGSNDLKLFYRLGLPVVISYEHEEESALARAEWSIFNSAFLDAEEKMQKVFLEIEENYLKIKNNVKSRKKVLVGDIQNGFWVFPGAKSDFSQMLIDAGAELVLQVNSRATQKISLEELVKKNLNPDFWLLNNNLHSKKELDHPIYKKFKEIAIYNYIARKNKYGANDFWETGISRPDLVLNDLVMILNNHDSNLHWYKKL